jgi:hypothetical protein
MILIICPKCRCGLRVTGEHEEVHSLVGQASDFWPNKFECYRCGKPAAGVMELEFESKLPIDLIEVNPQEAFAAVQGFGLPSERMCDKLTLNELLEEQRVTKVVGKDIVGSQRVMVDYLELADGSRIYLGSSNEGAVVYKITRPHSYVEALKEG